jgi:hypothetical protein
VKQIRKTRSVILRRRLRTVLVVAAAILGTMLIAGCGPGNAVQAQQLQQQYPWLAGLGLPFLEWLIQTYGSDILGLLTAAAAALG